MSYFLKKTYPTKKGLYLQIYWNEYIPGIGKRNHSYARIGYVSELLKYYPDPVAHFTKVVREMNEELEAKKAQQISDDSPTKNIGYFLLKIMFDKLNLDDDIRLSNIGKNFHFELSQFIRAMVYAQVVEPGSKLKAFEKVLPELYGVPAFSYQQILDTINYIGQDYESYIEIINHHIEEVYGRRTSTAYFDCTNYYFEIDLESGDRRKGPSKENRHDPIIGQALLLDEDQIPLAMTMYPGNESEKPYLRKHIEDLKARYDISNKIVQVADKGLNCARNIYAASKEAHDGYIFSKSVHGRNLSKQEKNWVQLDNENNVWYEVKDENGEVLYEYKEVIDEFPYKFKDDDGNIVEFKVKEKRIVTYNPSLAAKQCTEIRKEVEKARSLSLRGALKEEFGDATKYVKFITTNENGEKVEVYSAINQEKVDEDLKFAGYNLLVTSEIDKPATEIYKIYHGLWRIEESFRIMKTHLEARPVYLQTKESIYGHFLIVYYALTILRLLEIKVFKDKLPIGTIIDFIKEFKITASKGEIDFVSSLRSSYVKKEIKAALGLSKITFLYLSKKDIESFLNADLD